ncbi:MAG: DUF3987 domain-containing protein [Vampirovibrionales bacterium]|nr:DUF3987 domain-containing protein [Vampirovibrionales bacterium]
MSNIEIKKKPLPEEERALKDTTKIITDNLEKALEYLSAGWSIIPIHSIKDGNCTCGRTDCGSPGKHPRIGTWAEYQTRKSTPEEVKEWFTQWPDSNIATITGKVSNLVAIDIDDISVYNEVLKDFPTGCIANTGGGGKHLFYNYPEGSPKVPNSVSKLMPKVDVRGDGGYILLPPSLHHSGRWYEWDLKEPPSKFSDDAVALLIEGRAKSENAMPHLFTDPPNKVKASKADKDEVVRALSFLEADNYERWLKVGMALKLEYSSEGYKLWDDWSQKSAKYRSSSELQEKWSSFERTVGVTVGSIFQWALEEGFTFGDIPEPIALIPFREPAKPFPLDALGSILGDVAKLAHEVVQAPDAICGQSALAAAALAVQPLANISIDGRTINTSLFHLTIADSGERKSAVDNLMTNAIANHQKDLLEAYREALKQYKELHRLWKKQKDKKPIDTDPDENFIEEEPQKPVYPLMVVDEPTYEGLIQALASGLYSMGIFSDEGGRMIGGYSMRDECKTTTISSLSNLWDGRPISRVRATVDPLSLSDRRLSIHLMIQGVIADTLFSSPEMVQQGFLARFLISWPESMAGARGYNATNLKNTPAFQIFENKMKKILKKTYPKKILKGKPPQSELANISLSHEAKRLYMKFYEVVEAQQGKEGLYNSFKAFASKAPEQALRIAAVLTLFNDTEAKTIAGETMHSGIILAQYYLDEALRVSERARVDSNVLLAQKLLDWLIKEGKTSIDLKTVYQRGPNPLRSKDMALNALRILEKHYWVQRTGTTRWNLRLR